MSDEPKRLPITVPSTGSEELHQLQDVIESGWLAQGPKVAEFERRLAERFAGRDCCAVSSCTTGLHLALQLAGVGPGDVVLTVSSSFIATANAIRHCNAEPVFVDIDPRTGNLDPAHLAQRLDQAFAQTADGQLQLLNPEALATGESPLRYVRPPIGRLAAVLLVHQVGMPADLHTIGDLAADLGVPVVEDSACALGSEIADTDTDAGFWRPAIDPRSFAAVFSTHPRKVITTGEGGFILFREAADAETARQLRQHGMSQSALARAADPLAQERYLQTGFNYRMSDLQAAVGLAQLDRLDTIVARRRELADRYRAQLDGCAGITLPHQPETARSNWQSFIVTADSEQRQQGVRLALHEAGIASKPGIMCAHLEPAYRNHSGQVALPHSERAHRQGITLPLFPTMSNDEIDRVCDVLHAGKAP